MNKFKIELERVLCDPSTSEWLTQALQTMVERDPVDALADAEALQAVMSGSVETLDVERMLADFSTSHWLKQALRTLGTLDSADAIDNSGKLQALMKVRLDDLFAACDVAPALADRGHQLGSS